MDFFMNGVAERLAAVLGPVRPRLGFSNLMIALPRLQ